MFYIKERLLWISLIIILLGGYCTSSGIRTENTKELNMYLSLYKEAYDIIRKRYPDKKKTKRKSLFFGGISGMFDSLGDPHSVFMNEKYFSQIQGYMSGKYGGLGFSISKRNKHFVILFTLPNSPARKEGIKPRDRLIKVNGRSVKKWSIKKLLKKLKGKIKTTIKLTFLRGKKNKKIEITLKRALIETPDVEYHMLKNKIVYIKLKHFSNSAHEELGPILLSLQKQGINGIIFDLRGNPGGNLFSCVYIVNFFIHGRKRIVHIRNNDEINNIYTHEKASIFPELPLVVLSDGGSASASEIFIGAMQDHNRAVVIGQKSYGKGSVQVFQGSKLNFKVGYKVTSSKWYTPNERSINGIGLMPDIIINPKIKINDDEQYFMYKLSKSHLIERYVEKHPRLTKSDIARFVKKIIKKGYKLRPVIIKRMLKDEKYLFTYKTILDMDYDHTLRTAKNILKKQIMRK